MASKKILILPIMLSLIGHALFISATRILDTHTAKKKPEATITVSLQQSETEDIKNEDIKKQIVKEIAPTSPEKVTNTTEEGEEAVSLESQDAKFTPYLIKIKQKVGAIWSYPSQALAQKTEGTSTVEFTINRQGSLVRSKIVASSGHAALDQETIKVIRAASPYEPFPRDFKFSRLRVLATFDYRFLTY